MFPARILIRVASAALLIALPIVYSASLVSGDTEDRPEVARRSVRPVGEFILAGLPADSEVRALNVKALGNRVLAGYERAEAGEMRGYVRVSNDGGRTFLPETDLTLPAREARRYQFVDTFVLRHGIAALAFSGGDLYFLKRSDNSGNWSDPVRINDEISVGGNQASLLPGPGSVLYCAWADRRRGFPLIYFSSSNDGGATWGPNRPIEVDFREGDQIRPKLVRAGGGRILAFWEDYRDRQTLVDVRYSYSDDGGSHWSESKRINDDGKHVWQVSFDAVAHGPRIYVAFSDFRDPGMDSDNDWNIYFTASFDNGTTFGKNRRVNDVLPGKDDSPKLAVGGDGEVFCAWRTDRESIFGDVAAAVSGDGGSTWAPSRIISKRESDGEIESIGVAALSENRIAAVWDREFYGSVEPGSAVLEAVDGAQAPSRAVPPGHAPEALRYRTGETVFESDFSEARFGDWDEFDGVWMNVKGAYMGLSPGGRNSFSAFLNVPEPERYVLEGRFRLGEVSHFSANIYLRTDRPRRRYLMIGNRFRKGTWLSIKNDDLPAGLSHIGGRVLLQRRHNFQSDRWYRFRVVVSDRRLDYFVDERLLWSAEVEDRLPPGSVGIGGFEMAPTYFDDIAIHLIEP